MMFRQGDVLIRDPVPLPKGAKRLVGDIVQEGEVTGHAHRIVNGEVWECEGRRFVVTNEDASLKHEEHKKLELPPVKPGKAFPIDIQREYDDEEEWRQVAD